jgi:hypothetical protein
LKWLQQWRIKGNLLPRSFIKSQVSRKRVKHGEQLKTMFFVAFKFGEFTLKSGEISPVYFDLRVIVSYPEVMDEMTNLMLTFIQEKGIQCDQLCGVPYTGELLLSFCRCQHSSTAVSFNSASNCNTVVGQNETADVDSTQGGEKLRNEKAHRGKISIGRKLFDNRRCCDDGVEYFGNNE